MIRSDAGGEPEIYQFVRLEESSFYNKKLSRILLADLSINK